MGWRDRDYAKFRKDEFDAIYGRASSEGSYSTTTTPGATPRVVRRKRRRQGRGATVLRVLRIPLLAVLGTAVLLGGAIVSGRMNPNSLTNRTPAPVPVFVPHVQPPVNIRVPVMHRTTRIAGTRLLQYGGTFTLSGSHPPMAGTIVVSGRWGAGRWETYAVARGTDPTFTFSVPLTHRGTLHLRIAYPGGLRAVGTYDVR